MKNLGRFLTVILLYQNIIFGIPQQQSSSIQNDSLIITEVMFYPASGNNEFVEIYNLSSAVSVDLKDYQFKYYSSSPDSIIDAGYGTILSPGSYAVIFENDYDLASGIYNGITPSSSLILKISSNSFGSNGMANTTSRPIRLISKGNDTLDYYFYSADNPAAISDEKNGLQWDTSDVLWSNSVVQNGTPGYRNSSFKYLYDLQSAELKYLPQYPTAGDDLELYTIVINKGVSDAENVKVIFGNDINSDSIISPEEIINSQEIFKIKAGDTLNVTASLYNIEKGVYKFICQVNFDKDEYLTNNISFINLTAAETINFNEVVINEIMYAPQDGECEWVEVYNNSTGQANLKKWRIGDAASSVVISTDDYFLLPDKYLVLAKDSVIKKYYPFNFNFIKVSLPALNNSGDKVSLLDSLGLPSDTMNYLPEWGGADNRSLERRDPLLPSAEMTNWGTSTNRFRATPGHINSLTKKQNDLFINSFQSRANYGIIDEDVILDLQIGNKGMYAVSGITVSFFHNIMKDSISRESEEIKKIFIKEILPGELLNMEIFYQNVLEGDNLFITVINYNDEDTCNNFSFCSLMGISIDFKRNDLVINEVMYAPEEEAEWIELFNRSDVEINLKNFHIADRSDTICLVKKNFYLLPKEYLVISPDSMLTGKRMIPSKFLWGPFPPMNNNGDRIMIIDSLFRVIDSLAYTPGWGGINGCSLERIAAENPSVDSINWKTSQNKYKGTPGYINSVTVKLSDVSVDSICINPVHPVKGDDTEISVLLKNRGITQTGFSLNIFKDAGQDSIPDVLISTENLMLLPYDSVWFKPGYIVNKNEGIFAEVMLQGDQDTSNNYLFKNIEFGYEISSIIINEVHYTPSDGEPEWIELYNQSDDTINIKDWVVKDVLTTPKHEIIKNEYSFYPGTYLVISPDSSLLNYHRVIPSDIIITGLPNFNNDEDGVVLLDNRGIAIDSMTYINKNAGYRSSERLSFDASSLLSQNWGFSKDIELSSPGRINSVTPKGYDLALKAVEFNPRFPVLTDTVTIYAVVMNNGFHPAGEFKILFTISTVEGSDSLLSEILRSDLASGDESVIECPLKLNLTQTLRIKVAIEYIPDEDQMNNILEKDIIPGEKALSIVINEIMYDPTDGSPEWVEIYNTSNEMVNLKNWYISDILPSPVKGIITPENIFIEPGEYFIISTDSSLHKIYSFISNLLVTKLGALSSGGDGVILYDYREGIIDSVKYLTAWGGKGGRSLERKNVLNGSGDPCNWTTSLSPFLATPGQANSVTNIPEPSVYSIIINEIMYEPGVDNCEFIEFYNNCNEEINIGGWRIEDGVGNYFVISDTSLIIKPDNYFIFAADSSLLNKYGNVGILNLAGQSSLGLDNSEEMILLKDINNVTIDSLSYSEKLHNRNFLVTRDRSLERINPSISSNDPFNWTTCTADNGATPGCRNTVLTNNASSGYGISISPNPFSPDNDGWEDFAIINYNFNVDAPQMRIKIFDSHGRLMRTLADNTPAGSSGSVIFDGYDDERRPLRIGIYILYVEASGFSGTVSYKLPFVIARKL